MQVRFWGVRGSIAVCGAPFVRTGGNTPCVELEYEGQRLILDGGTGLRALGDAHKGLPLDATMLFTHVHWDHIQGVPFFGPAYHPGSRLRFGGVRRPSGTIRDALAKQMQPPAFPVTLDEFNAQLDFLDLDEPQPVDIGPFKVTWVDLEHPDGVVAYRVQAGRRSVVFATDVEHGDEVDERLVRFADGADLLIHDAQYTRDEYEGRTGPSRRGWGHSTWSDAVTVANRAGVDLLALYHHDPRRSDDEVDAIETLARSHFPGAFAARESDPVGV